MMNVVKNLAIVGWRVLAKKGTLYFIKCERTGVYSVDRITKGCGYSLIVNKDKFEVCDFFAAACKKQRKGKDDFNLEFYGIK